MVYFNQGKNDGVFNHSKSTKRRVVTRTSQNNKNIQLKSPAIDVGTDNSN